MTDLGTQLRASVEAQDVILAVLRDAELVLQHGNALYNSPADRDAYLLTLAAALRITSTLGDLDRLVRHPDEL